MTPLQLATLPNAPTGLYAVNATWNGRASSSVVRAEPGVVNIAWTVFSP